MIVVMGVCELMDGQVGELVPRFGFLWSLHVQVEREDETQSVTELTRTRMGRSEVLEVVDVTRCFGSRWSTWRLKGYALEATRWSLGSLRRGVLESLIWKEFQIWLL